MRRQRNDYRRYRKQRARDLLLRDIWIDRRIARYYRRSNRAWRARQRAIAYRDYVLERRYRRPVIVDRPYYGGYYDGYNDPYYGRNRGFSFQIGSRDGSFVFSIGSFDRNPYLAIPYTPYGGYAYADPYAYPVYEPAYANYGHGVPAYRRSDTFSVNIAGAPVSYTRYEEVNYAPAYADYGPYDPVYADYGYAPAYSDAGYSYDPWYEGDRYAIDPYADACYTDLGYADYDDAYYSEPVYYSDAKYSSGYFYGDRRDGRSFYRRHRNLINIGLATGAGAAIGTILGGKRGAIIGAGVGAGAGAVYTYGINPKDKRRYGG
ncbi:MAG: hypothetical protein IPM63_08650 [Acidobacteriota bacterium]|nr:MAG: hypothetical protein IPM63_08650 [Acidobacteriota bacterium]